jgi:hypothetical protein
MNQAGLVTSPAFALGRFRLLREGSVAYRVKKVTRDRVTERVMSPVECPVLGGRKLQQPLRDERRELVGLLQWQEVA